MVRYATIKSRLTGKAGFRLVDPGNIVHSTDAGGIVTITKLQPISVVFTASEGTLPRISKALEAGTATVEELTSNGQRSVGQGTLAVLNNQVDQTSGTISMKATFANADGALWPGLSVSTRLPVDTLKQVARLPCRGNQEQFADLRRRIIITRWSDREMTASPAILRAAYPGSAGRRATACSVVV
jgi:membrane fusion protein, multidrug efflux system